MRSESPTCLLRSYSQPAAASGGLHEGVQDELMRALTSSISFGRYASESFACEKWSSFTSNRYLEEAKKSSKPGSVKEMKAYFESHYKKIAANKAAALLEHPSEEEEEGAKEVDQLAKEQEQEQEDARDLKTEGSYEMEMETTDSAVVDKENSPIPFPPKVAVEEEEYKENILDSPVAVPPKAAAEGDEEEGKENIVNIPVPFKKPKPAVKEEKKKKPINCVSKSSINGSKPSNSLPPPPPPPLRSSSIALSKSPAQPKPIAQSKTHLPQIKKETSTRIQQVRKDDSIRVKLKKTDGNLLKRRSLSGPSTSFAAKHKELSQTIAVDNRKAKEKRILPSPAKHRVQEKKVDKNNVPEKKRPSSSSSSTSIAVGKKSDNIKTQLPTIDDHQYIEKKKKKSSRAQEMSQRPPWRFSFKSSPERRNGHGAEAYPVNWMTPRKKRIFR